jgi:hypothetical protein
MFLESFILTVVVRRVAKAKILGVSFPFFSLHVFFAPLSNDFEPQEEVKRVLFLKISRQILDNRPH